MSVLRNENFSSKDFDQKVRFDEGAKDCKFTRAKMCGADLKGTFQDCDFSSADLAYSHHQEANFIDCDFTMCDLTYASFVDCTFEGCTFHGTLMRDSTFRDCDFGCNDYKAMYARGAEFAGCRLEEMNGFFDGATTQYCV